MLRFAVALLVAAILTAQAQVISPEGRTMIGPLNFSCGKWTNTPKDSDEHEVLKLWVLGYLSGINTVSGTDFLRGRDADGLTAWIDNYCRRNPLHAITQAVYALTNELRSGR